ncbi:MAG: hypothetical protein K1V87_05640 [Muribaculum sp.]
MKTLYTFILSLILLSLAASCSRRHRVVHREIDRISAIADVDPDSALRLLDSMAPALAADDNLLMHYRLILVKARDKADMPFTSDSLIRPVVDYYRDRATPSSPSPYTTADAPTPSSATPLAPSTISVRPSKPSLTRPIRDSAATSMPNPPGYTIVKIC